MNFKKILLPATLSLLVFGCSTVSHLSEFRADPVVADGNSGEWLLPLSYYDMETQLNYSFANDKDNFYICIRASEPAAKRKILRMGINLGIEVKDKDEDKKINILYPNPPKDANRDKEQESENMEESRKFRKKDLGYLGEMQLTGFDSKVPASLLPQNDFGINVAVKMDSNNVLVYEAVIPFRTFYKTTLATADCKKEWMLTLKLAGLDNGEKRIRNNPDPSGGDYTGSRGGGGGMGAGGMRGGGRGAGMNSTHPGGGAPVNPLFQTGTLKVDFRPVLK